MEEKVLKNNKKYPQMIYKIKAYKYKLKAKIDDDIPKVIAYFKKHGVDIIFDFEETSVTKDNAPLKLFTPNDGKYDVVMYIYDSSQFHMPYWGLALSHSKTLRAVFLKTDTINDKVDYTWKSMCHEILHTLAFKFRDDNNVVIENKLDSYYKNEDLYAPDGNFAQQWATIDKYIKPLIVTITRKSDNGVETLGDLETDGFKCKTLELSYQGNLPNISCIPKGIYQCKYTFSLKFMKYTYEVQAVPKRSGIRIHSGNYFFDIQGCILLGTGYANLNNDKETDIVNSRKTITEFENILKKQPFTLIIK